ncbi:MULTISPECIES: three-helix bundle dimerization domain-containing protein [Janibacter]|uniref:Uncharacterized protein n=1 Tax=Janibacter hoylei PVAS-1 TaxID=1210046 RepID=K1E112_9MICO|nr:hypothetical protein [Janibacter hoylei]EKA62359.1 hypothetical protein B277_02591 [Janibacter hoylei PVAS-1]MCT1620074.1 hypothetical protein [Janibacter hoylei]MCT2293947.1 hypothetical protein [Janibacter hoylei]MCW4602101.1 hypothetical protein [Janibacter hoylei]RWU82662.1 hypothetical protein CWN80_10895 [Janibacter hoylei PVAS-1]
MITIHVDHVMTNMAADLCVRYPQVACERIEAMVASARERIEPTNQHPEFLAPLVEHAVKIELHELAGAPVPPTSATC